MSSQTQQPIIDVLIPAQNEEDALGALLAEIDHAPLRRILVVDNVSTDDTARVAREAGCEVVYCATPGYGSACLEGLAHMRKDPPEVVIFLDGDRSDYPSHMPELYEPILANQADMVLGSRRLGKAEKGSLTITQQFGNWLATTLMRIFWGARYTDLGPFRAVRWSDLESLHMRDPNFGWTIEMQIKAWVAGLRVMEVPVNYRNRIGISKISGTLKGVVLAGYKILYTIFKYRLPGATGSLRKKKG